MVEGLEGSLSLPISSMINWRNNITWMLQSKNKETGDYLSIIPKYTLNSFIDWQATESLSLSASLTWYGSQTPKKYDFKGDLVTGSAKTKLSPYSLIGLSGHYAFNRNLSLTLGIDNLLDKRLFRAGNASGVNNIDGAGAATYNEPGRTFYISTHLSF